MKILISGSRKISQHGMSYAKACVRRVKERGDEVIVGDAPGIDAAVIAECDRIGVPVQVWYRGNAPRHRTNTGQNVAVGNVRYTVRDELMVSRADIVVCVWNGRSKGTKHVYDYATAIGTEAHIRCINTP